MEFICHAMFWKKKKRKNRNKNILKKEKGKKKLLIFYLIFIEVNEIFLLNSYLDIFLCLVFKEKIINVTTLQDLP